MIAVGILINGQPITARSARNTGERDDNGRVRYRVDDAVALAKMLLDTTRED